MGFLGGWFWLRRTHEVEVTLLFWVSVSWRLGLPSPLGQAVGASLRVLTVTKLTYLELNNYLFSPNSENCFPGFALQISLWGDPGLPKVTESQCETRPLSWVAPANPFSARNSQCCFCFSNAVVLESTPWTPLVHCVSSCLAGPEWSHTVFIAWIIFAFERHFVGST